MYHTSKEVSKLKELFREVMLHLFECEDRVILELGDAKVKEAVRKAFEDLRLQLTKTYAKRLKERHEEWLKATLREPSLILMPSKLVPRPLRGGDRARAWVERIGELLENYDEAVKQLRKG
ncbi:MAG: hypothetical protein QXT74_03155 [Candidatus Nezhaarchaeales archaeon]